jgi:hypothetical protein
MYVTVHTNRSDSFVMCDSEGRKCSCELERGLHGLASFDSEEYGPNRKQGKRLLGREVTGWSLATFDRVLHALRTKAELFQRCHRVWTFPSGGHDDGSARTEIG